METATSTGTAYGAALIVNEAQQTLFRVGAGGYARISGATQLWAEEGDTMPGVARHNTMIPFVPVDMPVVEKTEDILIRGGRDFILDLIVYDDDGAVQDITGAVFMAQIRRYRYAKYAVAMMGWEILDGPTGSLRLRITPDVSSKIVRCMIRGVWDLEMQLGGVESTVIPESKVRVLPGISQGNYVHAGYGAGSGVGNSNA